MSFRVPAAAARSLIVAEALNPTILRAVAPPGLTRDEANEDAAAAAAAGEGLTMDWTSF